MRDFSRTGRSATAKQRAATRPTAPRDDLVRSTGPGSVERELRVAPTAFPKLKSAEMKWESSVGREHAA